MAKKDYYFVTKNNKKNLILMLIILVIACVLLAVISLIPGKFKDKWLNTDNGTARSTMFPFVYTSDNALYVLNENLENTAVDDSVSSCIHDVNFNNVYYLRENKLFEYDIDTNKRINLSDGVVTFRLFADRTSILCTNNVNDIYLYLYKDKGSVKLNKNSLQNLNNESIFKVGNEYFLFLDNYDFDKNTASLMRSDLAGSLKCLATDIDASKAFYISDDDSFVSYYKGENLMIADIDGKVAGTYKNAKPIVQNTQPFLTEPCTKVNYYSDGVAFMYFLTDISENGSSGDLVYFTDDGSEIVDSGIRSVVHFCDEDKLILYTKDESNGFVSLYKSQKGGIPSKIITCSSNNSFFFNESSTFLYIQSAEGFLRRINVYDKGYKVTDVSEGTGVLFDYAGKSFVGYHNLDADTQYLILDTNTIEKFSMNEIRYYGKYTNKYLLCREYSQGKFTLDYTVDGYSTRIASDIDNNIYFDKEFDYVIFSKDGKMYVWSDGITTELSNCSNVNAVTIISAR